MAFKHPNWFKVPHEIIDDLPRISGSAAKVALVLFRLTRGFHRDSTTISLARLSKISGISPSGVSRACTELENLDWIKAESHTSTDGGYSANTYYIDVEPDPIDGIQYPPIDGIQEGGAIDPSQYPIDPVGSYKEERNHSEDKNSLNSPTPLSEENQESYTGRVIHFRTEEELYLEDDICGFVTNAYRRIRGIRIKLNRKADAKTVERLSHNESHVSPLIFRSAFLNFLDRDDADAKKEKWPIHWFLSNVARYATDNPGAIPESKKDSGHHPTPATATIAPKAQNGFNALQKVEPVVESKPLPPLFEEFFEERWTSHPRKRTGERTTARAALMRAVEAGKIALCAFSICHEAWCLTEGWKWANGVKAPSLAEWVEDGGFKYYPETWPGHLNYAFDKYE